MGDAMQQQLTDLREENEALKLKVKKMNQRAGGIRGGEKKKQKLEKDYTAQLKAGGKESKSSDGDDDNSDNDDDDGAAAAGKKKRKKADTKSLERDAAAFTKSILLASRGAFARLGLILDMTETNSPWGNESTGSQGTTRSPNCVVLGQS